jgi:hypothetical protein
LTLYPFSSPQKDRQKLNDLIRELDSAGFKSAADTLEHFQYDVMNYMQFPQVIGEK